MQLLFAFLLATRVLRMRKQLPNKEYEYLATGGASAIGLGEYVVVVMIVDA